MFGVISTLLKYIFITIIYLFIYGIIRLIYLDIRTLHTQGAADANTPYLKLVNRRESLDFKVAETYPVSEEVRIGRKNKNGIVLQDPFLSGEHARIYHKNGQYYLEDLGSTNGSYLNGRRLENGAVGICDGDRIRVGQLDFLFVRKEA